MKKQRIDKTTIAMHKREIKMFNALFVMVMLSLRRHTAIATIIERKIRISGDL
jgi:hypothetical protein